MSPARGRPGGRIDVLIYVQHLLGTGHLHRAAAIARAAARAGLDVVLVSGGLPVPGLEIAPARLVQLPPARTRDETFSTLVDADGAPVTPAWEAMRRDRLLALYRDCRPRLLLVEMFPFGRRRMRFELLPLLELARAEPVRPPILCSLRDVLTTHRTPGKEVGMIETFETFFDLLLVHGDPAVLPLERSFPAAARLRERTRYTGYVVAEPRGPAPPPGVGDGEVIVSCGSGATAGPLLKAALAVRAAGHVADAPWRLLIGPAVEERCFAALAESAAPGLVIERARGDFRHLLARARLSISRGGYNTVMDILAAGVPAVIVPFTTASETEQGLRARILAERGAFVALEDADLNPASLAMAIDAALARPDHRRDGSPPLACDGAAETARILRQCIAEGAA